MRRGVALRASFAVLALALLPPDLGANQESPQLQVFRSAANAVSVDVSVQNRNRRPLTGLTAADFEVLDNGVPQDITDVSYGRLPIDVTIALDVSYSVNGLMLARLRRGVSDLMRDLSQQDRLKLMLFNSRVARSVDFTNDSKRVEEAIQAAAAGGGTSLLDAISVSLFSTAPSDRRHLLVVFTDGSDSTSTTTPAMLSSVALRSRTSIALVLPGTAVQSTASAANPYVANAILSPVNTLAQANARAAATTLVASTRPLDKLFSTLVDTTGGAIVPTTATSDLSVVFRQILSTFRSTYVLLYNARGVDARGYHTLEVKVKREGAIVNSRRGYWY